MTKAWALISKSGKIDPRTTSVHEQETLEKAEEMLWELPWANECVNYSYTLPQYNVRELWLEADRRGWKVVRVRIEVDE